MGLFSSSKTTTAVDTNTTVDVVVNPANTITIDSRASADAISSGVGVIGDLLGTATRGISAGLSDLSNGLGSGVSSAGINIAFGLVGAAAVLALAKARADG